MNMQFFYADYALISGDYAQQNVYFVASSLLTLLLIL